jgi:hypothetical protein
VKDVLDAGSAALAVEQLLDAAQQVDAPEPPTWFQERDPGTRDSVFRIRELTAREPLRHIWFERMRVHGLAGKMALFWHNFFPVEWTGIRVAHHVFDYYYTLLEYSFGNFKDFVHAIGLTPAMLQYLDGVSNHAGGPNENYARELLELFTMGPTAPDGSPNYTEQDVVEIARALTGWTITDDHRAQFIPDRHDNGVKEILGQRGVFGYDEVMRILFEERSTEIAHFVCRNLYCFFVRAVPDDGIVHELAERFLEADFEIRPVLEVLFSSEHFYDTSNRGARIKSSIELIVGMLRETETEPPPWMWAQMYHQLHKRSDNNLLQPPNVGGWPGYNPPEMDGTPGHYAWLDTQSLEVRRWYVRRWMLTYNPRHQPTFDLVGLTRQLAENPNDPFEVAVKLAELLMSVPLSQLDLPEATAGDLGDPSHPPPDWAQQAPSHVLSLAALLLDGTPHYDWPDLVSGDEHALKRTHALLQQYVADLMQTPAYQLT